MEIMMVGKVAGDLFHIGPVYLQQLGQSRKGQSLAEVVIIIIVSLGFVSITRRLFGLKHWTMVHL
jgi:hypothetical protein